MEDFSEDGAEFYSEDEMKVINLFRENIGLILRLDSDNLGWLANIALDYESSVKELVMLAHLDQREPITNFLNSLKSLPETDPKFELFKKGINKGDNTIRGDQQIINILLKNGDVDNAKLFLSICPDQHKRILNITKFPIESIVFLINTYPKHIPKTTMNGRFDTYRTIKSKLVEKLLRVGHIIKIDEYHRHCEGANMNKIREIIKTPPRSLFEVSLRQCRRLNIDLSAIPVELNYVN